MKEKIVDGGTAFSFNFQLTIYFVHLRWFGSNLAEKNWVKKRKTHFRAACPVWRKMKEAFCRFSPLYSQIQSSIGDEPKEEEEQKWSMCQKWWAFIVLSASFSTKEVLIMVERSVVPKLVQTSYSIDRRHNKSITRLKYAEQLNQTTLVVGT